MPHCPHCGNEMLEFAKFCPACGQAATQPPPVPEPSGTRLCPLPLGEYLKTGWRLFLNYPGGFIGFCLAYVAIEMLLAFIPWIGRVASFVIGPALLMGSFIVSAKLLQGHTPQFSDFFLGFRFFFPLLLTALVGALLTTIGFLLLIIPGIYLLVGYIFAYSLVIDRRLDFWTALELSRRTVNPIWFGMFGFLLLLMLINLAGIVALGIGSLVTIPVTMCALTAALCRYLRAAVRLFRGFPG